METKKIKQKIYHYYIGIDVSKSELDFAVLKDQVMVLHKEIPNSVEAVLEFVTDLKKIMGFRVSKALFCLEDTGLYGNHVVAALKRLKACVTVENPQKVKKAMGLVRGKSDKMDAIRIAQFAQRNKDELRPWVTKRPILVLLKKMISTRERLLSVSIILRTPLKEQIPYIPKAIHLQSSLSCKKSLTSIAVDLDSINLTIKNLIDHDERLKSLYQLITSVPGVGPVCAYQIILSTNEFLDITDPRKFACYAGVAPFKNESGRFAGKAKISNYSNKKAKMLLHMAAMAAIRSDVEIKAYYQRKTEGEGKPKMAVINAVRNKIILRVFACIRKNRTYIGSYEHPMHQDTAKGGKVSSTYPVPITG
jgi:transposase